MLEFCVCIGFQVNINNTLAIYYHQVEMLYQRYFLRTNQSHMVHLLVLLCILFTCMAIAVLLSNYESRVQCSLLLLCCILIYLGKSGAVYVFLRLPTY